MSTYSDKLQHPKWQRKRLEVMQRDDFQCQFCHSEEKTLHVHHRRYISGRKPWEYSNDDLITLCSECHEQAHALNDAYQAKSFTEKQELLSKLVGKGVEIIRRGAFALFADPVKPGNCIVVHIPTSFWHGFSFSIEKAVSVLDNDPDSKRELLKVILEGASASFSKDG